MKYSTRLRISGCQRIYPIVARLRSQLYPLPDQRPRRVLGSAWIVAYSEVTWFWGTSDRALNLRFGTACLRSLLSPGVGCQGIELLNVIRIEIAPCFLFTHHHKKLFRRIRLSNAPCCTAVFSGALEL